MKHFLVIFLSCLVGSVFAQPITEKEVKTEVNEVTVFIDGAQLVSRKSVDLLPGTILLKFIELSPFIDSKSIQVKALGEITVLSVNHQKNFLSRLERPKELIDLEQKLQDIDDKIKLETTYLSILTEELAFLKENRNIGGKSQELSVTNLKDASVFYSIKLTSLKLSEIERNKTIQNLNKQKNDIRNQMNTLTNKKEFAAGEILVKIEVLKATHASFELSYLVENAGWFPSYDIRVKSIDEPVELVYKANIWQDTKVDWKNVKLKFSSSNPNVSGVAPELRTYFLNYNSAPPRYKQNDNSVTGRVINNNNEPMVGVTVLIEGTTIGTVTDNGGNFSITRPNNTNSLVFSSIGYKRQTLPISNSFMNVVLEEDEMELNEIVVLADEEELAPELLSGYVAGVTIRGNRSLKKTSLTGASTAITVTKVENQTNVEFEIKTPYTVNSDNKSYSVEMANFDMPASYTYFCVPKIDKNAFLLANIIDWEKYNLLEGEANIFFEETYVGKTLLDVRYASDTLTLSLGQDKNVSVNREKVKDFTTKQFIGSKKEENRTWLTTVKNNKNQKIDMVVIDQVPVSTMEEIEIATQNNSGAKQNAETGEIKWEFSLQPNDKKEFQLKYSVKYPKNRMLIIE